jgi:hypothetical protein
MTTINNCQIEIPKGDGVWQWIRPFPQYITSISTGGYAAAGVNGVGGGGISIVTQPGHLWGTNEATPVPVSPLTTTNTTTTTAAAAPPTVSVATEATPVYVPIEGTPAPTTTIIISPTPTAPSAPPIEEEAAIAATTTTGAPSTAAGESASSSLLALPITTAPKPHTPTPIVHATNNASNILIRSPGTWTRSLTTQLVISATPRVRGEQAGLIWYIDDDNYIKLVKETTGSVDPAPHIVFARGTHFHH